MLALVGFSLGKAGMHISVAETGHPDSLSNKTNSTQFIDLLLLVMVRVCGLTIRGQGVLLPFATALVVKYTNI